MNVINANLRYIYRLIPLDLNQVKSILIHHLEARTATPQQIHQWHLANGWSGAGYNEYIRKDGTVYIMRGDHIGVHCANYNGSSYGIACEGSYNIEREMSQAQYNSLIERIKYHKNRLPNNVDVSPHSKYFPTSCPGRYFPMNKLLVDLTKKSEITQIDHELTSAINYLKRYHEPTEYRELIFRFKQIIENSFEKNNLSREQLRDIFRK